MNTKSVEAQYILHIIGLFVAGGVAIPQISSALGFQTIFGHQIILQHFWIPFLSTFHTFHAHEFQLTSFHDKIWCCANVWSKFLHTIKTEKRRKKERQTSTRTLPSDCTVYTDQWTWNAQSGKVFWINQNNNTYILPWRLAAVNIECFRTMLVQNWHCKRQFSNTDCILIESYHFRKPPYCGIHLKWNEMTGTVQKAINKLKLKRKPQCCYDWEQALMLENNFHSTMFRN